MSNYILIESISFIVKDELELKQFHLKIKCLKSIRSYHLQYKNSVENCCVCYKTTHCQTFCKHPLCYYCYSRVRLRKGRNGSDPEIFDVLQCPLCRINMVVQNDDRTAKNYE